ncbi:MAG: Na+/H+ antiporter NhaA [Alphaproteobacteria bacterium]|nr:Na+/H+ antiporter NhaA [Alphaproteobacteria bacterium]
MVLAAIRNFLKWEASAGLMLIGAAAAALIAANSSLAPAYAAFLDIPVAVMLGDFQIAKPLLMWINDLLMAVFFFLVGLEIKREFVEGELSTFRQAVLPFLGAVGGMALPAAIYLYLNAGDPTNANGWAIPAATDIAFALGILVLAGSRVPIAVKVLLTAIAILDDLGAIVIIAAFYTPTLSTTALSVGAVAVLCLAALNIAGIARRAPYMLVGIVLWAAVLKSGVHATLAGVILALFIPIRTKDAQGRVPLHHLEHALHPWVAFAIVPLFGFANAGVSFAGMTLASLFETVTLGIAAGLFVGKQIGIFGTVALAILLGLAARPAGASWLHLYAMAVVSGIGFTMSLFIGRLAFEDPSYAAPVRLGVLVGSLASTILGLLLFRLCAPVRAGER